jgi:hypothetical protein
MTFADRKETAVTKAVLVVYTNPITPDREDDFNKWYDAVHLPEVLQIDGFTGATRYRVAEAQAKGAPEPAHRFMAIYEVDTAEPQALLDTMLRDASKMDMGDSLDWPSARAHLYEEISPRLVAGA